MSEISVTIGELFPVAMLSIDGRTDLYPRVQIFNSLNVLVATVDLSHVSNGLYQNTYTFTTEGVYSAVGQFFSDPARTVDSGYERQGETFNVTQVKTNIERLLGLSHHNSVVDQQVFTSGQLTSARLRVYDTSANASVAQATSPAPYLTGLKFTYQIAATYNLSGELVTYLMTTVP